MQYEDEKKALKASSYNNFQYGPVCDDLKAVSPQTPPIPFSVFVSNTHIGVLL